MLNEFLYAKIHRATVTEANLEYVGSITIDKTLLDEVGLKENQKVEILNINNGERFSTYIIEGKADSGVICLNGAAARCVHANDKIIIMAYCEMDNEEAKNHKPKVVFVDDNNKIERLSRYEKHGRLEAQ